MQQLQVLQVIDNFDSAAASSGLMLAAGACDTPGILCGSAAARARKSAEGCGYQLTVLPDLSPGGNIYRALREIYGLLKKVQPEIIHAHGFRAGMLARTAGLAFKYFGGGRNVKFVYTPHGGHFYAGWRGILADFAERILAHKTAALAAASRAELNAGLRAGIGYANQWVVIPAGVSENFAAEFSEHELFMTNRQRVRDELTVPQNALALLYCGRLIPQRGLDILLNAMVLVRTQVDGLCAQGELDPDTAVRLIIAGDGPLEQELKTKAAALNLNDVTVFAGWRDDAAALMSACDVFVQPSRAEALGRAVIEAQAAGIAVVCSEAGGLPEAVNPERSALIAHTGSAESLAGALMSVIANSALRTDLGMGGQEWVNERDANGFTRFSDGIFVLRHRQLYSFVKDH